MAGAGVRCVSCELSQRWLALPHLAQARRLPWTRTVRGKRSYVKAEERSRFAARVLSWRGQHM